MSKQNCEHETHRRNLVVSTYIKKNFTRSGKNKNKKEPFTNSSYIQKFSQIIMSVRATKKLKKKSLITVVAKGLS